MWIIIWNNRCLLLHFNICSMSEYSAPILSLDVQCEFLGLRFYSTTLYCCCLLFVHEHDHIVEMSCRVPIMLFFFFSVIVVKKFTYKNSWLCDDDDVPDMVKFKWYQLTQFCSIEMRSLVWVQTNLTNSNFLLVFDKKTNCEY